MGKNEKIKIPETISEAKEIVKKHVVETKNNISDNYIYAYVLAKDNAEDKKWLVELWDSHAASSKDGQPYLSKGAIDEFLKRFPEVQEKLDKYKAAKEEKKKKRNLDDYINALRKEIK